MDIKHMLLSILNVSYSPCFLQHLLSFYATFEQSRKEYEQQVANEEAEQLRSFHEAVAAQSNSIHELEAPTVPRPEESKTKTKRIQPALLKNVIISVKPQAKKAKVDPEDKPTAKEHPSNGHNADHKPPDDTKGVLGSLVAYEDDECGDEDV
ncbi:hypothetical protein ABZP36_024864 [Zizania latifolia]